MATRRQVDGGRGRPAPARGGPERNGPQHTLVVAGVEICKSGENLPREDIRRRLDRAGEVMWKKLHDEGCLPLTNDTGGDDSTEAVKPLANDQR
jgi:hypothetical protein